MRNFVKSEVEEGLTDEIGSFSKFWKNKKEDKELVTNEDIKEG